MQSSCARPSPRVPVVCAAEGWPMPAHSALEASEVQQPMPSALSHLLTQGQSPLNVLASLERHGNWLFLSALCRAFALLLLLWSCSTGCGWLPISPGISFPREHIATVPAQTCPFVLSHFPGRSGQMDTGVVWGCGLSHATPDSLYPAFLPGAAPLVTLAAVCCSML